MLISFSWLKALAPLPDDPEGVARRLTSRGLTVDSITASGGDAVLDIDVPANRPDALGHRGVAREAAAALGLSLAPATAPPAGSGDPVGDLVEVAVEAPDLCGRYTARVVRGVRVGPSPGWVVDRLAACGLRSINNVVDASNLVMLELGQPVHFFDLATLSGPAIRVRRPAAGESLVTLDGVARKLDPDMLVIADARRAVALAGVMGGADSEIKDTTRDILIEAAWFLPRSVRRTARALGLSTDASQRFERGCDPEAPAAAQDLAVSLLAALAGGTPAPGMIDARVAPPVPRVLPVRLARAARLLGYAPTIEEATQALAAVGLSPRVADDVLEVTVPSWRVDLEREVDLVEEIGRHLGYDRIPSRPPAAAPRAAVSGGSDLEESVRDRLVALGFGEAFNYAMIGLGDDDAFVFSGTPEPIALTNPIAETLAVLRRAVAPGLLRSADQNLRRGAGGVRLFEVGRVFLGRRAGELPDEPLRAAFAWAGSAAGAHWSGPAREVDPYDAAGLVEDLLAVAAGERSWDRSRAGLPGLHSGRAFAWRDASGRPVAWCGPVHPDLAARLDLAATVWLGEIDLTAASGAPKPRASYRPIPRVPGVERDLSIVLEPDADAGRIIDALEAVAGPAPATFAWIDRYAGPPLAPGEVAMTLRVILHPLDRTLTDVEAEAFRASLVEALESVRGARLRRIDT